MKAGFTVKWFCKNEAKSLVKNTTNCATVNLYKRGAFLYLIGSVFAPMIAVQIADHFILHRDRFAVAADARNLVIWLVGFIAYRLLMGVDTPVGYTLPDMVLTVVLCLLAEKVKPTKQM